MGGRVFGECGLTSITIPAGVLNPTYGMFLNCNHLTTAEFAADITYIPEMLFCGCNSITTLGIPHSVIDIVYSAFGGGGALISVN